MAYAQWWDEQLKKRKKQLDDITAGSEPEVEETPPESPKEDETEGEWYEPKTVKKTLRKAYRAVRGSL